MTIKLGEARGDVSIINFGSVLRSDPAGRYELFRVVIPRAVDDTPDLRNCEMLGYQKGRIPRKGRLRMSLPLGERFLIIAQGDKKAGMIHTSTESLMAPFFVTIDAPPSEKVADAAAAEQRRISRRSNVTSAVNNVLRRFK